MNRRLLLVFALLAVAGAYVHWVKPQPVLLERPLAQFPARVGDWRVVREDFFSRDILEILRPTDYLSRDYAGPDGAHVTLYIGYHGGRKGDGGIHSPKNCLPSAGWFLESTKTVPVQLKDGSAIHVVNTVMSKGLNTVSFYYWFQVRGEVLTDEVALKLAEVWNSISAMRKDAAFIRLSMEVKEGGPDVDEAMVRFIRDCYPAIYGYLPK